MRCINSLLLAALLMLAPIPIHAAEFRSGDTVQWTEPLRDDLFIAGRTVGLSGAVGGDLFAAGLNIALVAPVGESAYLAGFDVTIDGPVAGDLIAGAGELTLNAPVAGDATVTAATVSIGRGADIAGDLNVSGGEVTVASRIAGDLRVAGGRVVLSGSVLGDVDVAAGELEMLPGARVGGTIRHRAPDQITVNPGAQVEARQTVQVEAGPGEDGGPTVLGTLGRAAALFVLGWVVYLAFPGLVRDTTDDIRARPWRNVALGFAAIILAPLVAVLFIITIIGIPVGFLLLLLYAVAFPVGLAVAGFGLAELARRGQPPRFGDLTDLIRRFAFFAVLLTLVGLVPGLGELAVLFAMALGMGALLGRLMGGRRAALA